MLSALCLIASIVSSPPKPPVPISLHPKNGHYLLFRGKPTVLITSGEHYGAVMNLDFDYSRYLDTLHADGLNLTRLFSGAYVENSKAFNIKDNTLAPFPNRYICPWARSETPGYANGGAKFDLTKWDEAYFRRLKDFCSQAGKRGIVVEVVLFCPFYDEGLWHISPMNASNNINGVGSHTGAEAYTLKHPEISGVQDSLVKKITAELAGFDNIYYEICNEPYFGGVTLEWQRHIAEEISRSEVGLPYRHLIAQNIANGSAKITEPFPEVSIFNFHYANPPDAVPVNYALNRVIAFDETGFKGSEDFTYRAEAWEFLLSGGAIFSNLDYSFSAAHPDGTAQVTPPTPGGGSPAFRKQLKVLKDFMESFDLTKLTPTPSLIRGALPSGVSAFAIGEPGNSYGLYIHGGTHVEIGLNLLAGKYKAEWINTHTGGIEKSESVRVSNGAGAALSSPNYTEDIALRIKRKGK
jgi:hypothetical protein